LLEVTLQWYEKFYCRKRKICSKRLSIATEVEGLGGYLRDQEEVQEDILMEQSV
jgi:hypothetical protein